MATLLVKRITIMTIRITFGGEGTPDPPLPHQTLLWEGTPDLPGEGTPDPPLQRRHTRLSPGEGTPDIPGEGTPDPPLLEGAHQTLGEGTPDPPHSRQTVYSRGRCQAAPIAPIRGQVLVSARHPQQTGECMMANISHRHTVLHSPVVTHTLGDKPPHAAALSCSKQHPELGRTFPTGMPCHTTQ